MRALRWLAVPLALLAIPLAFAAGEEGEAAPGIAWQKDLAKAKELAAREGKPLLLYFTFDT